MTYNVFGGTLNLAQSFNHAETGILFCVVDGPFGLLGSGISETGVD